MFSNRPVLVVALWLASACGTPAIIGAPCKSNGDCASMQCQGGFCTTTCSAQTDCPVGFDCGLAHAGDGGPTCYARTYDQTGADKGGFGASCSLFAPDPKDPTMACSTGAMNPCAAGYTCNSARKCDPNAYCTKGCAVDTDCPANMFCGTPRTCVQDMTTMQINCTPDTAHKECMRRSYCEACTTDDQCYQLRSDGRYDTGWACAVDSSGYHYCAQKCNDDSNCPHPANDQNGFPNGDPFEKCTAAGAGSAVKVCAPANGYCSGKSTAQDQPAGGYCSGCRAGHPEDCAAGTFCYQDEFTSERWCTNRCTLELKYNSTRGRYEPVDGSDSCQKISPNLHCPYDVSGAADLCCNYVPESPPVGCGPSPDYKCPGNAVCIQITANTIGCALLKCDSPCTYPSFCGTDPNQYEPTCFPYSGM